MRFLRLGLLSLICHVTSTWALHESDVGVVDWHKQLIGVPLYASTHTAPVFHNVEEGSIVLTATGNNVLAALNPADGSVGAWFSSRSSKGASHIQAKSGDTSSSLKIAYLDSTSTRMVRTLTALPPSH